MVMAVVIVCGGGDGGDGDAAVLVWEVDGEEFNRRSAHVLC
jgi:hypothetical protein